MKRDRYCDGITRRDCLTIGAIGGSLGLSGFLNMSQAGVIRPHVPAKRAIFIFLAGGPSHIDTFDPKPNGPVDIRGEFKAINTNVPGMQICEHLPNMAKVADKFSIIRGVSHTLGAHALGQSYLRSGNRPTAATEFPTYGSVVDKKFGVTGTLPSHVAIPNSGSGAGYLGVQYNPLETNQTPKAGRPFRLRGFSVGGNMLKDINRRKKLLSSLDRKFDQLSSIDENISGWDYFTERAHRMITSREVREAFEVERESESIRSKFGDDDFSQSCLMATRLVQSGVRFVSVNFGGWDTHRDNFATLKDTKLPQLDLGLSGLLSSLDEKGLLESTAVWVTGEFGRTPKINSRSEPGGRDHYPRCMFSLMAGGGIPGGQVYGESDEKGAAPKNNLIKPDDVAATFYHQLGINHRDEFHTPAGRPVMIVRDGSVLKDFIG